MDIHDLDTLKLIAQMLKEERDDIASARLARQLQRGNEPASVNGEDEDSLSLELALQFLRLEVPGLSNAELQSRARALVLVMKTMESDAAGVHGVLMMAPDTDSDDEVSDSDSESVLVSTVPSNFMGKGKGRESTPELIGQPADSDSTSDESEDSAPASFKICGICFDPFKPTYSPRSASRTPTSSDRLAFGLTLPCPSQHDYCLSCLTEHIRRVIDPRGDGRGTADVSVFPVRCPECPIRVYTIDDDVAQRVLDEKSLRLWRHQQFLDLLPKYWCPYSHCAARLDVDETTKDPRAECPDCRGIFCAPCRAVWHEGVTCREFQSLPIGDRHPDDLLTLLTIKSQKWRRCPNCHYVVELMAGCNHMTCRCGTQFCFSCGAMWDRCGGRCPQQCALWNEDMLLDESARPPRPVEPSSDIFTGPITQTAKLVEQYSLQPPGSPLPTTKPILSHLYNLDDLD